MIVDDVAEVLIDLPLCSVVEILEVLLALVVHVASLVLSEAIV